MMIENTEYTKLKTIFLRRHILRSDEHTFIGRIYDLSIVAYHFESYQQMAKHDDCRYALDVNENVTLLARRVESLNFVGSMLWPRPMPKANPLPISKYEWLTVSADVFLMRFISVVDCLLQVTNSVFEVGLPSQDCKLKNFKKVGIAASFLDLLAAVLDDQEQLRKVRNARIHEGVERTFTHDDNAFKFVARYDNVQGIDITGQRIDVDRYFKEGLVGLQREFNQSTRKLVRQLDKIYDELEIEFEKRFSPKIRAATNGLNANARRNAADRLK